MHYYKHHIGDYAQATAHLTMLEDGCYSRLLRKYYADEKPLPADIKQVQRLVGARTKEEKDCVEAILNEFFILESDGWRNKRADQEIEEFKIDDEDGSAKKKNERERQKRHREERKKLFEELRCHNIVPAYDTSTNELRTMLSRVTGRDSNAHVTNKSPSNTLPVTADATAIHKPEPITNNQKPEPIGGGDNLTTERPPPAAGKIHIAKHPLPPNFGISPEIEHWAKAKGWQADLPEYLEVFRLKAEANGYEKTNWESAFKTSMLEDWGKVRERKKSSVSAGKTALQLIEEEELRRAQG